MSTRHLLLSPARIQRALGISADVFPASLPGGVHACLIVEPDGSVLRYNRRNEREVVTVPPWVRHTLSKHVTSTFAEEDKRFDVAMAAAHPPDNLRELGEDRRMGSTLSFGAELHGMRPKA